MDNSLLVWICGVLLALLGAPLLPGIINKVKAYFAGRRGPSVFQLYYDIFRLFHKASVYSATTTWIFRISSVIVCATTLCAMLLLPFAGCDSPLAFTGDLILFLYLMGTGRFFTVLAALDTGSSFEGMGASRECQFAVLAEGAILAAFGALILLTKHLSLFGILNQMDFSFWSVDGTALILVAAGFFVVILTECCRVPIDDPDTHLELTMIHEAMILDNSGADLALIHYAASLKMWCLLLVEILLVFPRFQCSPWIALGCEVFFVLLGAVVVGVVESVIARFRFCKVPQLISAAMGASLLAIVLLTLFQK